MSTPTSNYYEPLQKEDDMSIAIPASTMTPALLMTELVIKTKINVKNSNNIHYIEYSIDLEECFSKDKLSKDIFDTIKDMIRQSIVSCKKCTKGLVEDTDKCLDNNKFTLEYDKRITENSTKRNGIMLKYDSINRIINGKISEGGGMNNFLQLPIYVSFPDYIELSMDNDELNTSDINSNNILSDHNRNTNDNDQDDVKLNVLHKDDIPTSDTSNHNVVGNLWRDKYPINDKCVVNNSDFNSDSNRDIRFDTNNNNFNNCNNINGDIHGNDSRRQNNNFVNDRQYRNDNNNNINHNNQFTTPNIDRYPLSDNINIQPNNNNKLLSPSFNDGQGNMSQEVYTYQLSNHAYDQKNFLKKEFIPALGKLPWILWYRQFVLFALRHGVYVPPFESMEKENIMGKWYDDLPYHIHRNISLMSGNILSALQSDILPNGPELTRISSASCGYVAIHNLFRGIHPKLMERSPKSLPPRYKQSESIDEYVNHWRNFLLQEQVCNRHWNSIDYTQRLIDNLPYEIVPWVQQKLDLCMGKNGNYDEIPPLFHIDMIASTIQSVMDHVPSTSNHHKHIRHLVSNGEWDEDVRQDFEEYSDDDILNCVNALHSESLKSPNKCIICDMNHELVDCHKLIAFVKCKLHLKSHPEDEHKVNAKYKHIPQLVRRSMQSSNRNQNNGSSNRTQYNGSTVRAITDVSVDDVTTTAPQESIPIESNVHCITSNVPNFDDYLVDDIDDIVSNPYDDINNTLHSVSFGDAQYCTDCSPDDELVEFADIDDAAPEIISNNGLVVQFDGGANINTTNQSAYLWCLRKLKRPYTSSDAGKSIVHVSHYRGYLVFKCSDGTYKAILTYFTPSIKITVISPHAICRQFSDIKFWDNPNDVANNTASADFMDKDKNNLFSLSLSNHRGLLWTDPVIRPTQLQKRQSLPKNIVHAITSSIIVDNHDFFDDDDIDDLHNYIESDYDDLANISDNVDDYDITDPSVIHQLNAKANYHLWHQRFAHAHSSTVTSMHKHSDGVPKLPEPTEMDSCPICLAGKMRKSNSSKQSAISATQCFQSISLDMGFIVQKSKNKDRYDDNVGINGETCYILITDQFSGMVFGKPLVNKSAPDEWLNQWLARHSPDVQHKSVRMDQGSELGRSKRIVTLFKNYGYNIELTGSDASNQNGLVERCHQTVGTMLRTLLIGSGLQKKFWPYAFYHSLFILNRIIHKGKDHPPITICSGKRISLQSLRTFGCRVYVKLPGYRQAKLDTNHRIGFFLGYTDTLKNIFWYDPETNRIKVASHVRFDEGMSDLPDPTPNVKMIQRYDNSIPENHDDMNIEELDLSVSAEPFRVLDTVNVPITCELSTFGIVIGECSIRRRAYISSILPKSSISSIRNFKKKYVGSFIVGINNIPIFDVAEANAAFASIYNDDTITNFNIILAPDKYIPIRDRREHMTLDIGNLRHLSFIHSIHNGNITELPMTDEEKKCNGKFSRKKLKTFSTWPLWKLSEKKQLDKMHAQQMYGTPCLPPHDAIILRRIWRRYFKDGLRRSRDCCDGSPRAAPILHELAVTYASCIDQPVSRLYWGICCHYNLVALTTDVENAFAHARAPKVITYVYVDDAFIEWYYDKFGIMLTKDMVLPANHALQGHPESPRIWEEHINHIIIDILGFHNTTHERSIYSGTYDNHQILIKRQVDDLAVAAPTVDIARAVIREIGKHVKLVGEDLLTKFNGVEVNQTRTYIQLHCTSYIDKIINNHGWDTQPLDTSIREPLQESLIKQIDIDTGPSEHSKEAIAIEKQAGFKYRQVLGELMYAYVICRLDIGYILTKLAQFSQSPAPIHYTCLRRVALYLRNTKSWGIIYWRPNPMESLPSGDLTPLPVTESNLPPFPSSENSFQLEGYVDAAHATDLKTRRSVTGFVITICGAAICYRSKQQTTVATSSTEAEFIAAVTAAKAVKYLRSILQDLGPQYAQEFPTPMYEDNEAAISMINASKPTPRSRHIDIQHFAIQEWKLRGDILFNHIAGIINMSDSLTKGLGWVLHNRHVRRAMGHHLPAYLLLKTPHKDVTQL